MRTDQMILVGAGGHAKVVLDALFQSGYSAEQICITDHDVSRVGKSILGVTVRLPAMQTEAKTSLFHVAVGDGSVRQRLCQELEVLGNNLLTITHPGAQVSRFSLIGAGSFIAARAVIAPSVDVGRGVIINHGAVIDHDCVIGDFSHIAPNATLGGAAKVGAMVLVGAGANVLPGIHIGDGAVIGAGAVVLNDVDAGETYVGVPAVSVIRRLCD